MAAAAVAAATDWTDDSLPKDLLISDGLQAEFTYSSIPQNGQFTAPEEVKQQCFVLNGRGRNYTVERNGFALQSLDFARFADVDVYDMHQCAEHLYPVVEDVLRAAFPSCTKPIIFDHILRNPSLYSKEAALAAEEEVSAKSDGNGEAGVFDGTGVHTKTPMLAAGPVTSVHGDYTVRSGFTRAADLLRPHETQERIEAALAQRFAFVNVWVPLRAVERDPLALIDWQSAKPQDVVNLTLVFKHRQGEIYKVLPSKDHRWVYFPDMQRDECIVFKTFDSATDEGRARHVLHSAFTDPTASPAAPPRESVEVRCVVFFGDLPSDFAASYVAPHLLPDSPDQELKPLRTVVGDVSDEW
mmetsp:Transcript_13184/g.24343  ORF Transcript_13184/g.24343 Transcript_13184/m.24343 type:complete len:356 (+) Transcript_13184:62-1129(+)